MNETKVVEHLLSDPDFFLRHPDLLEQLTLPHPVNGKVISLLEYQVCLLRESANKYRGQFERLVDVARENEATMHKSQRLVLAGLTCTSLDDLSAVVDDMVRRDFGVPYHTLILYDHQDEQDAVKRSLSNSTSVRCLSLSDMTKAAPKTVSFTECFRGTLPNSEQAFLFPDKEAMIRSVAVLPLLSREGGELKQCGVLVLGSDLKSAFAEDKGVVFLQYLADLLSAIVLRLLP